MGENIIKNVVSIYPYKFFPRCKEKEKTMEPEELNKKAVYTEVTLEQQARINDVRILFSNMYNFIEATCKPSRETSLAITKLEEAQFWAIKGISREEQNYGRK